MYGSQTERTGLLHDLNDVEALPNNQNPLVKKARVEKAQAIRVFLRNSITAIVSISFIALLLVGFNLTNSITSRGEETLSLKSEKVRSPTLTLTASNEYGAFLGPYPWMTEVVGTQLVEPYKNTTLTLSGSAVDSGLLIFKWDITGLLYNYSMKSAVGEIQMIFEEPTIYNITITAYRASDVNYAGVAIHTYSTRLVCK